MSFINGDPTGTDLVGGELPFASCLPNCELKLVAWRVSDWLRDQRPAVEHPRNDARCPVHSLAVSRRAAHFLAHCGTVFTTFVALQVAANRAACPHRRCVLLHRQGGLGQCQSSGNYTLSIPCCVQDCNCRLLSATVPGIVSSGALSRPKLARSSASDSIRDSLARAP